MSRIRVFWVDDSQEFLTFARELLKQYPSVELLGTAASVESALEGIDHLRPDVIFMDFSMPGMTGLAATKFLKSRPQPPRIVLVTGSDLPEYRQAARDAQADGFLAKPDLMDLLGSTIEQFL
jgi:CheY-like chemotaxis protein